ncbi:MAG: hypothetical protein H0U99_03265 [Chthoniobacterales bacterium]|nr:hypothetical protein [Chthoniobacterales bacterium]
MTSIARQPVDKYLTRPIRKWFDHTTHFAGRCGVLYFITICCAQRGDAPTR